MKYLFSDWVNVSLRIEKSPRVFLFFDYDGTLTPIVATPEEANISTAVKNSLKRLKKNPKFSLAIISGRSLKNIKKTVGIRGVIYAGNHGLEIDEGLRKILKPAGVTTDALVKRIKTSLRKGLKHIKGCRVEDKGPIMAVHFRLVRPRQRSLVKKIFRDITAAHVLSRKIRVSSGKMVLEVRPGVEWDKGRAVLYLLGRHKGALAIYLGDDLTDEDAFRAIKHKGISIFVGRPKKGSKADYFLKSPKEVEKFIERLINL